MSSTSITSVSSVLPGTDVAGATLDNGQLCQLMEDVRAAQRELGLPADFLGSTPEFPDERLGIRERRVLDASLSTRELAIEAGWRALAAGKVKPADVRIVLVSTVTPDKVVPAVATSVQSELGLESDGVAADRTACPTCRRGPAAKAAP